MKPNVLYISYDGMTDPLGQSQVLPYLFELSKYYNVHLMSAEKSEVFQQRKDIIQKLCDENNINWHPFNYTKTPPVLSTLKDIRTLFKTAFKLHLKYDFKLVHCRSYISALVGLSMKKKWGVKFLFDMRGFWADERVDGKIWNLKNPIFKKIYRFFKKMEIDFIQNADHIVSLTQTGKDEILSWSNISILKNKISVIPCCADLNHFSIEKVDAKRAEEFQNNLNISSNDYILSYLGSIGTWYMLDEMLDFFKELKKQRPNSKFLFITKDNPEHIFNHSKNKGIDSESILIQPAQREELPSLLSLVDSSIFFILPAYSKKASSPTKQAELLAMGIPVICNNNVGDTGKIVLDHKVGWVVNKFNSNEYLSIINSLDFNYDKEHLRKVANTYASLEIGANEYLSIYKKLIY